MMHIILAIKERKKKKTDRNPGGPSFVLGILDKKCFSIYRNSKVPDQS